MHVMIREIKEGLRYDIESFLVYIRQNISNVLIIIVTVLLTYGYELTNFTMTIDDEQIISRGANAKNWVSDGRYTIAFLRTLIPYESIPYWHNFLFILVIIISAIVMGYLFHIIIADRMAEVCFSVLFASMPIHIYYECFSTYCEEMALAYLLTTLSIFSIVQWCEHAEKRYKAVMAIVLEVAALGVYQGFIPVYIILTCTTILLMILAQHKKSEIKNMWKVVIQFVGIFVVSMIGYFAISLLLKEILHVPRDYLDGYMRWGKDSFSLIISEIFNAIKGCSIKPVTHRGYITIPIANFLLVIAMIVGIVRLKKDRCLYVLCCLGMYISSIFFFIVMGGYMPPRAMLAMPVYVGGSLIILLYQFKRELFRSICLVFTVFMVLYQSSTAVKLNVIADRIQTNDRIRVENISEDIAALGLGYMPTQPVAFVGVPIAYESVFWEGDSNMGYSYFTLGRERLQTYFSKFGYDYLWANENEQQMAEKEAETMPMWPQEGAIKEKEGVIIVNLSGILSKGEENY